MIFVLTTTSTSHQPRLQSESDAAFVGRLLGSHLVVWIICSRAAGTADSQTLISIATDYSRSEIGRANAAIKALPNAVGTISQFAWHHKI